MNNYTINTYEMKRDIVNFSKKICDVNFISKFRLLYKKLEFNFTLIVS